MTARGLASRIVKAGPERGNSVENREKKKKPVVKLGTKSSHAAYFMPMLESFAARDDLNEVIKNRVSKACDLLDAGVIFGTGFAPFRGGPIQHIRAVGADAIVERLKALQQRHGDRFAPRPGWDNPVLREPVV